MSASMLPPEYFAYPNRRLALDHDWFDRRMMRDTGPFSWPGGAKLAVWITIDLEHFPMDMPAKPFVPTGGMLRPYPSYWDYTQRDYGNRVGVFRLIRALDAVGLGASVAANSEVLRRYRPLADAIVSRGWEIVASGVDMGHLHHGDLPPGDEAALIERSLTTLRDITGDPVVGWHSPANSCSMVTYDLLAAAGVQYVTDWINDELPFAMRTRSGPLMSLPRNMELSDKALLVEHVNTRESYAGQVRAACDLLLDEAERTGQGRILSLSVSPWVLGQPWCIATFEKVLAGLVARDGVWFANGAQILSAFADNAAEVASGA